MSSNKTIDGLPVRRSSAGRTVSVKTNSRHTTSSAFAVKKSPKTKKPAPKAPAPRPTKQKVARAHADFLKPVETFDFTMEDTDIREEEKHLKKSKKLTKTKKKPSRARKIITSILLVIVLLLISAVIWLVVWGNDLIAKLTGGTSNIWDTIGALTSENYVDLKTDENGRTNILIFGTSGFDMDGTNGDYEHDGSQLTDSIMALSLDQVTGDVAMVSLPRDLKVTAACYAGKINEVYTCNNDNGNNEQAGAEALEQTVSEVLGLDFQYYVHINWESLLHIVDTLGGITVTLDEDIDDYGWTNIKIDAGVPTTLDGWHAVALARARHGTEGGDFTRGTSQQKILIGIKDRITEMMSNGSFGISEALGLVSSLGDNLRSNISIDEIKTGIHLAETLNFDQMRQVYLIDYINYANSYMTTSTINGISYVIPVAGVGNYGRIHEMVQKEFSSNPVVREGASVLVLNGTDTAGLAGAEAESLKADGYIIGAVDNAPEGNYDKSYYIYLLHPEVATETAKALKGIYNVEVEDASALPAGIETDCDVVLILGGSNQNTSSQDD